MRSTITATILVVGILGSTSVALAEHPHQPSQGWQMPGQMMPNERMMGRKGMSEMMGMMGMMGMMSQMGPMFERCNEMMAAMTEQLNRVPRGPKSPPRN